MTDSAVGSAAWRVTPDAYEAAHPPAYPPGCQRRSLYVATRDGTRLAVDVQLPIGVAADARLPAILIFTPYYRRFKLKAGHPATTEPAPNTAQYRDFFVARGYAVVVVDVRGTGASFGTRYAFRSPAERDDSYDVAEWLVAQPWSNGRIGSIGISYVGAAACFLASTGHPAVRAVIPTFAVWDTYADHYYPGGVLMAPLADGYDRVMVGLDQDRRDLLKDFPYFADPHFDGPAPVDEDRHGMLLARALGEHTGNFEMASFMRRLECRDDTLSYDPDFTVAKICPYHYAAGIREDVAYYCVSGWMDGGSFANGAIHRFRSLPVSDKYLLLGPWDHGARTNVSPFRTAARSQFALLAECRRFFDEYLAGKTTGLRAENRVHYFIMGAERWVAADDWPPPATAHRLYFAAGRALDAAPPTTAASDSYRADYRFESGADTRYERLFALAVEDYYATWQGRDAAMLCYTSAPMPDDKVLLGSAILSVHLNSTERDGVIHAYLEDVAPDGTCRYVTEGVLRALHRNEGAKLPFMNVVGPARSFRRVDAALLDMARPNLLRFALFPTAWLCRKGHRLRLALAAADRRHFARIPDGCLPTLTVHRASSHASNIELPFS
jgi:hypothetical protein